MRQGALTCGSIWPWVCKSCAASWGLCSPECAQGPENLHLSPYVQHCLHFWACAVKLSALFGPLTLSPAPLFGLCTPANPTWEWWDSTHCFFTVTSFSYSVAFQICIHLMTWAVSQVFLKWTRRSEPLDLHDLWGFLGQVYCAPFLEITSDPVNFMMMAILTYMMRYLIVVLIFISLIIGGVENLFKCCWPFVCLVRSNVCSGFWTTVDCVVGILYIFRILNAWQAYDLQTFSTIF